MMMMIFKKRTKIGALFIFLFVFFYIQMVCLYRSYYKEIKYIEQISMVASIGVNKAEITKYEIVTDSFFNFFPSRITLQNIYRKGPFPLNSEYMNDIIDYVRDVFDYNCKKEAEVVNFIISDPTHNLLRQHIREKYGMNDNDNYSPSDTESGNVYHCFLFSIGYRDDVALNQQVDYEAYIHKDIIRVPILDEYRETAHKIILTLYLLDRMNHSFKYALKSDDDIFLRINKIIPDLRKLGKKHVFIGHKIVGAIPIRNNTHKWFVDEKDYPGDIYNPYLNGPCYIMRRSIIRDVSIAHYNTTLIPMEDIHISYLVSGLGYDLTDSPHYYHCLHFIFCKNSYIVDVGRNLFRRNYIWKRLKKDFITEQKIRNIW
ncbi:Beta-1,3-galactosyltransferase 1 [Thelohanellus kitauei]|uniref:Hexosyltransferase n=1 Tax=Thelohanellus kitauei TaxID=669202 RepID=A0A0C2J4E1_THEKT|nr:Beta-1,3-galactosyltransferase 1 [Thelohanellus kitauei]